MGESSAVSKDKVVMGTLGFEDEEGAVDPSSLSAVSAVSGSSGGYGHQLNINSANFFLNTPHKSLGQRKPESK